LWKGIAVIDFGKGDAPGELRDGSTPEEVIVNQKARVPTFDPTVGVPVDVNRSGQPRNRLVTIGDSLTQGFQSGAIFNTRLSWPMIVAWELGCDESFRFPTYDRHGGLPLNIEVLIRRLEENGKLRDGIDFSELPLALFEARHYMAEIEDYWEKGAGSILSRTTAPMHNMAVYGWDVRDVLARTRKTLVSSLEAPKDNWFRQVVQNHNERAALRVYGSFDDDETVLDAAKRLGNDGCTPDGKGNDSGHGIEVLIVLIGANNALGSVTRLKNIWSDAGYDDVKLKSKFTVWRPSHFTAEFDLLAAKVAEINARHVIFGTVPHVTIAPIAKAVGKQKSRPGSRYFPFYTRPWIDETAFDPKEDPHITHQQARAVDSAIDQYNEHIESKVQEARRKGKDWYVADIATLLDRLATVRYREDPLAQPEWWTPYELPSALSVLEPIPNSCFFESGPGGRTNGGLFSLDGVHPTTIGYGVIAQEIIDVMRLARVPFLHGDSSTPRRDPIRVDFKRLIALDTLISSPPKSLHSDFKLLGKLDQSLEIFGRLSPFNKA
jgi:hypothetical protein